MKSVEKTHYGRDSGGVIDRFAFLKPFFLVNPICGEHPLTAHELRHHN